MKDTVIIIPTRLGAKRFKNKPLAKINGIPMNRTERKNTTWHSNMDLIPNMFNVLKKLSIEVEIMFNEEFLPNKEYDRKKLALYCWKKINYNLINSLYRK